LYDPDALILHLCRYSIERSGMEIVVTRIDAHRAENGGKTNALSESRSEPRLWKTCGRTPTSCLRP
jgi:hypothetical protein